jgi:hypothetical protein
MHYFSPSIPPCPAQDAVESDLVDLIMVPPTQGPLAVAAAAAAAAAAITASLSTLSIAVPLPHTSPLSPPPPSPRPPCPLYRRWMPLSLPLRPIS